MDASPTGLTIRTYVLALLLLAQVSDPSQYEYNATSELELNGEAIERVKVFRYLGVSWVSEYLNWSHHILKTTKRASKLIDLIYRRYYMSSSQGTLLQLYLSFVRPIVEYAAPVWDPHYACHIQALEKVQKFALRMSAKLWDHDYDQLLLLFGLPTLESRRKILKLCYLAGTLRGAIHCTHPPLQIREMDSRLRSYSSSTLVLPFTRTRSYQHSFFLHAMKLWNDLPPDTKSCPSLFTFKRHLKNIFT